jgi:hypothetical protein
MTAVAVRRPVPLHVAVLALSVVAAGVAAATVAAPVLWWITPLMAGAVLFGWTRAPAFADPDADPSELPPATRQFVRESFGAIPDGDALRALRGVVHPARTLFGAATASGGLSPELLRDCAELVEVSCATAVELARLEQLRAGVARTVGGADRRALRHDLTAGSDLLRRRLGDAAEAITRLYVQSVERGSPSSDRVAELVRDLTAEVSIRRRANAEVEALLGSRG